MLGDCWVVKGRLVVGSCWLLVVIVVGWLFLAVGRFSGGCWVSVVGGWSLLHSGRWVVDGCLVVES